MYYLDALYVVLAVGFAVLVGFISYAAFEVGKTLRSIREVIDDVKDITSDARFYKDQIKDGILGVIRIIFGRR